MNKEELKTFALNNVDNFAIQLKRHYPHIYNEINKLYNFSKFCEKLFVYINGDNKIGKCKICGEKTEFDGYWKGYREYCSCKCRSKDKSDKASEIRICVICGNSFKIRKKREKTTCSQKCLLNLNFSSEVNEKRKQSLKYAMINKYGVDHPSKIKGFGNRVKLTKLKHFGHENFVNIEKANKTRLERYGDPHYINTEKYKQTCLKKYGVPNILYLPKYKSNGKRISKFQKKVYTEIKQKYTDALLEEYLPDVQKSVDIYIPSEKKIIECFGDYWHCNPDRYAPDYYNGLTHRTAQQTWDDDTKRIELFKQNGYKVEIIWENTNKKFKHSIL